MENKPKTPIQAVLDHLDSIPDVPEEERDISDDDIVEMVREVRKERKKSKNPQQEQSLQFVEKEGKIEIRSVLKPDLLLGVLSDCADKPFEREKNEKK
ncbi:MAG: hypothetical protein JJU29_23850 [Verrucomicrobia bacterium]|nr:hypothetical protein [Verrucomicrobiota bacterium]